ncbi:unnamed protein product [Vicia faba]|uniref:Uncharacterized protein n=1 Tax=Vicia faba TaxID=3906 RepID=A0AAV0Z5I6_VICFA|nr:unnamed protein product [Vicia faba]
MMKLIEQSQVSPPPNSLPSPTTLPLTFFDIPWFYCQPVQRIFFYRFPHPTHHFLQTTLPILKHSLSLTLQHFFPFSSNLIIPPNSDDPPYIRYLNGDSLSFTVSESSANFNLLISDSQDAQNWHPLVANLPPPRIEPNGARVIPIMAIQLTVLPNHGFSICLTFQHVAGDGKSLHHFMKYWASLSKASANNHNKHSLLSLPLDLPSHERDRVKDTKGLKSIYLQELQDSDSKKIEFADSRDSSEFSLPKTYFGNCLTSYTVSVKRNDLLGENGIIVASNGIEKKIRDFKSDALLGAETLMSHYRELSKPGKSVVVVAGSPKLAVYETDFGWGKPVKSDSVHLDSSGSISLSDCRDGGGGIEVGLALDRSRMANFISIFQQQLDSICNMWMEENAQVLGFSSSK